MILLLGGKEALKALQAASIAGALPFTFVIIAMTIGLLKSLRQEGSDMVQDEEQIREMINKEISDMS